MSKASVVLIAGLLAATFACAPASAQTRPPSKLSCKDARLDQVINGNVASSQPACRHPRSVAFDAGADRECAMLSCTTFILTGVGD
jgi:hypothetical protein